MELIRKTVEFCKENLLMTAITAAAVFLTVISLIVALTLNGKAKKAKRAIQTAAKAEASAPASAVKTDVSAPAAEMKKEAAAPAMQREVKIEAKTPAVQAETRTQDKKPIVSAPDEKTNTPAITPKKEAKKTAPIVAKKEMALPKVKTEKTKNESSEQEKSKIATTVYESTQRKREAEDENKQIRYKGKWVICHIVTDEKQEEETYFFELHASNGEVLLSSEEYSSYAGALRGIQTHKSNIARDSFKITVSKKGDYIFKILSGKNLLLCTGANYPTRARCENAVASVKRFAETAVIDENVQVHYVKMPKDDDAAMPTLAEGCTGKWIIDSLQDDQGETLYYFELFANNGVKLLSSEEYTTYIGAVNGIQTHKKNIASGNFRISLTKRGDYIYKLLNGNGQLLCLGEHYKTKRLCQNAVESVKRFGLNSPTLTAQSNLE